MMKWNNPKHVLQIQKYCLTFSPNINFGVSPGFIAKFSLLMSVGELLRKSTGCLSVRLFTHSCKLTYVH